MLTKKDLKEGIGTLKKEFKEEINSVCEDLKEEMVSLQKEVKKDTEEAIATAIGDLVDSVSKVVATKEDLQDLATKEELRESEERIDEKARDYRDQILTKMDKFLVEINSSREERVLISEKQAEHSDRIENLEKDVKRLKTHVFSS